VSVVQGRTRASSPRDRKVQVVTFAHAIENGSSAASVSTARRRHAQSEYDDAQLQKENRSPTDRAELSVIKALVQQGVWGLRTGELTPEPQATLQIASPPQDSADVDVDPNEPLGGPESDGAEAEHQRDLLGAGPLHTGEEAKRGVVPAAAMSSACRPSGRSTADRIDASRKLPLLRRT